MNFERFLKSLETGNANQRACAFAMRYGSIDGSHHKMWVIDQMLRILAGGAYRQLIEAYNQDGYEWDTGIAP